MTIQTLIPELNPSQLKQLERLISEEVIGEPEDIRDPADQRRNISRLIWRNELRQGQETKLRALLWGSGEEK